MSNHQASLDAFSSSYQALFALLEDYPIQRRSLTGACGYWSPREVLAHLSGWLVEVERRYDMYDAGDAQSIRYDFDEFNARSVAAREALSWEDTVAELERLYDAFVARAGGLSPDVVAAETRYTAWLDALDEDCREHAEQLRSFAEAETP